MKVVERPLGEITPYENNPRQNRDAVKAVVDSIREFGFRQPIVVDESGVIVVGHTRFEAAGHLELATVPVHVAEGMTPDQIRAYRIMDNRSHENAAWDADLLKFEFEGLRESGFDLDLTGFGTPFIDSMLDGGAGGQWPTLPENGGEIGNMTFVVSSRQRTIVETVLRAAKKAGLGEGVGDNENSNGNALTAVCEAWAQSKNWK